MTLRLDGGQISQDGEMTISASNPGEATDVEALKEYLDCVGCGAYDLLGIFPLPAGPARDLGKKFVVEYKCDGVPLNGTTSDVGVIKTGCRRRVSRNR